MEPRDSIDQVAAVGQQTSRDLRGAQPGPIPNGSFPGDHVVVTSGEETFGSFKVGPIIFETSIGPGEDAAAAYARASTVAHAMFEAEFQLKRVDYERRRKQVEQT